MKVTVSPTSALPHLCKSNPVYTANGNTKQNYNVYKVNANNILWSTKGGLIAN